MAGAQPLSIAAGPDGNLWFSDRFSGEVEDDLALVGDDDDPD